jgi:hypothetical protein
MRTNFISTLSPYLSILFLFFSILFLLYLPIESVNAQPPAISDLVCSTYFSTCCAIQLVWTVPSGAVAYEVKYSQGNSIDYDSASAYTYNQSWSAGTSGQKKSEIIFGLNPGTEFTIALKSKDAGNNWSGVSNPVTCQASPLTFVDTQPPTSQITEPKDGATILAGKDYIIKGQSSDPGGSVQKVEISFDGKNWFLTKPKESIKEGFTFEYLWEKPKEGNYQIKTRATDWWDNQEIPGEGINVKVVAELPIEKPPVEKPIPQMTAQELKAKIIETQLKLIELMKQLIQLLQQQITQLKS